MADGYWNRRQPTPPILSSGGMLKRPRTDYDAPPSGLHPAFEMHNYLATDDDRSGHLSVKDTKTIGSAYDRYLQSAKISSFTSGEASTFNGLGRAVGAMPARPIADTMGRPGSAAPDMAPNGRNVGYGGQLPVDEMSRPSRDTVPLPPDASSTLYVEGLPPDSTTREVARILCSDVMLDYLRYVDMSFMIPYFNMITLLPAVGPHSLTKALDIFRPFVGYKEVRLVSKESRHRGGDPIILCFVDFSSPACAATAMSALQGYNMDEHDPESNYLRLQFSRYPGPRSSAGARGRR